MQSVDLDGGIPHEKYVVGVDYGTMSGRALVVRVSDGAELGNGLFEYLKGGNIPSASHAARA